MLIFSENITPRLRYIIHFFSQEISDEEWRISSDAEEFITSHKPKINYSNHHLNGNCLHIVPHTILFENIIVEQNIQCTKNNGLTIFFQNESETGFDIFAAGFYLLSRYEEYLPFTPDKHGRFPYQNSLAYREGFLKKPLINYWLQQFKNQILSKYPDFTFKEKKFQFLPTYDIDMAWSYRHKGFWRNSANVVLDLLTLRFWEVAHRLKVLAGMQKDPFDVFDWLDELHEIGKLNPLYFFLVAERVSKFDKNISPKNPAMKRVIEQHSREYSIGLHPSYRSNEDEKVLISEKGILSEIAKEDVQSSRQHYLKMNLPETYRRLLSAGIRKDFTMGYAGSNGFRASVASSFIWYDLKNEIETDLLIIPFCFMEATSVFYKKDTPEQAFAEMKQLYNEVKTVNGMFSTIWHNNSLADEGIFKGWKDAYDSLIVYHTSCSHVGHHK
jgi:hypothetical protein